MSDFELAGKTAVVTGASKGIGKRVSEHLLAKGCNVVLVSRDAEALKSACAELSQGAHAGASFVAADLSIERDVLRAAEQSLLAFGTVDILVNVAGATKAGSFPEQPDSEWIQGFALKFFGAVRLARALWPTLKAQKGVVINIGGAATYAPSPGFMVGGAVNAALAHFSKALSLQGLKDDVNVNIVHPGMTVSDRMFALLETQSEMEGRPLEEVMEDNIKKSGSRRLGDPDDIANLVTFLCSPTARHIQGQSITVDGGASSGFH